MREIKFRAWFNQKPQWANQMFYSDEEAPGLGNWFCEVETQFDKHGGGTIMQYTDLKDKNGKEIYEGDIVRIEYEVYNPAGVQPKYPQRFMVETVTYGFAGFSPFYYKPDYESAPNLLEVIGNIHENPELV